MEKNDFTSCRRFFIECSSFSRLGIFEVSPLLRHQNTQWSKEKVLDFKDHWNAVTIPVNIVLDHRQTALPLDQVLFLIRSADNVAIGNCFCRNELHNCDNPLKTCLGLNMIAIKTVEAGIAEFISSDQAEKIVRDTHQKGLLHLALHRPDGDATNIEGICSCCPCCCSALHGILRMNLHGLLKPSPFFSTHDPEECTNCGACTSHCVFQARTLSEDGVMVYDSNFCFGCGHCVARCPENAIIMSNRDF